MDLCVMGWVQVGDVTGDGKLDIVTFNDLSSSVSVLAGNGAGQFGTPKVLGLGTGATTAVGGALADMNNDGRLDIISANVGSSNVSIFTSLGNGSFSAPAVVQVDVVEAGVTKARELAIGDLNKDGWNDIVTTNPGNHTVSVLMSDGKGGLKPDLIRLGTGATSPFGVELADVNGDGRLDIITSNFTSHNVSVITANAAGGFNSADNFSVGTGASNPVKLTLGDVNGDGKLDIVTANQTSNNISVLTGNGLGGFNTAQVITTGVTQLDVSVVDINGDGKNDILATSGLAKAVVVTANGTGGYNTPQLLDTGGANTSSIQVVDVNGDNRLDMVVSNYYSAGVGILTAVGETSRTVEDTAVSVALKGSDVDGTIASFQVSTLPAHGALYLDAGLTQLVDTSTVIAATSNAATLYFKPDADWNGSTSLAYVAVDDLGAASVAPYSYPIVVSAVNDAPVLTGASAALAAGKEGNAYTISQAELLQGWSDVDGNTLTVAGLTAQNGTLVNNNNGSWTFTPAANFNGTVNLSYNVIDGQGGTSAATQSFNLAPLNTPPALTGTRLPLAAATEDTAYSITLADLLQGWSDVDAGAVLGVQNLSATNGTLAANVDGSWTFTPAADFNGTVQLAYTVIDGQGASAAATHSFEVAGVNDQPALTGAQLPLAAGSEDTAYTLTKADLLAGWSDVDGDTLS
ncbi:MAG: hypothetical protein RLZZ584_4240, partial [Pseudomonadota bacterium]